MGGGCSEIALKDSSEQAFYASHALISVSQPPQVNMQASLSQFCFVIFRHMHI